MESVIALEVQVDRVFVSRGGVKLRPVVLVEIPDWHLAQLLAIVKGTKVQRRKGSR